MTMIDEILTPAVGDVHEARAQLRQCVEDLVDRLLVRRAVDVVEREARDHFEDAARESRREIGKCVRVEGTKSFIVDQADGTEHQVSAPDRDKWLEDSIRIDPIVVEARRALREAEDDRARAADAVLVADRAYSAAKADLAAAVAVLHALTGTETR